MPFVCDISTTAGITTCEILLTGTDGRLIRSDLFILTKLFAVTDHLCRDSKEEFRNLLKSGAPDGHFWSPEIPLAPVIAPL